MGLTTKKIQEILAKYPGSRKIAVQNFLMTMSEDYTANYMNLEMDSNLYKWDESTYNAIFEGINEVMKENPNEQ